MKAEAKYCQSAADLTQKAADSADPSTLLLFSLIF